MRAKEGKCNLLTAGLTLPPGKHLVCEPGDEKTRGQQREGGGENAWEYNDLFFCSAPFASNVSLPLKMWLVLRLKTHRSTLVRYSLRTTALQTSLQLHCQQEIKTGRIYFAMRSRSTIHHRMSLYEKNCFWNGMPRNTSKTTFLLGWCHLGRGSEPDFDELRMFLGQHVSQSD